MKPFEQFLKEQWEKEQLKTNPIFKQYTDIQKYESFWIWVNQKSDRDLIDYGNKAMEELNNTWVESEKELSEVIGRLETSVNNLRNVAN